jgi:phosphoglycolate phosphatase-like HAD superfamily hydrolase
MFAEMRNAVGVPPKSDILDHIYALPLADQEPALEKIRDVERKAMLSQVAQPGLLTLMSYLEEKGIPKGICTRNFDAPVTALLDKFLPGKVFAPIVTRDFRPPKPDPAGILHIAKSWGLKNGSSDPSEGSEEVPDANHLIMVGDSLDDMTAGYRAGAATVLLVNDVNAHLAKHEHTDLVIRRLDELVDILDCGFVGKVEGRGDGGDVTARVEKVLESGKGEGVA